MATNEPQTNAQNHRILDLDVMYIPDFITRDEEEYLIRKIQETPQQKWKVLANRRLQIWGGEITARGVLVSQPFPAFIAKFPDIVSRIAATGVFEHSPHGAPNHVILNEYLAGQGIMPHEDGPSYHPVVATLSLGSHCVFNYYQYEPDGSSSTTTRTGRAINKAPMLSVLLEQRSLIISYNDMYTSHLHGIDEVGEDLIGVDVRDPESNDFILPGTQVENLEHLTDEALRQSIHNGIPLKRNTRFSLTCRDVVRASNIHSGIHR